MSIPALCLHHGEHSGEAALFLEGHDALVVLVAGLGLFELEAPLGAVFSEPCLDRVGFHLCHTHMIYHPIIKP